MSEVQSAEPEFRLYRLTSSNLSEKEKVLIVDAILEQAPSQGTVRDALFVRYNIPANHFNGWLGSLDQLRERAGMPAKVTKKISTVSTVTSTQARSVFGFGHDKEESTFRQEPVERGRRPRPDAFLSPALQDELKELTSSWVIPKMEPEKRRRFTDGEKKKIMRIRFLRGLISPSSREQFMASNHLHDPQIYVWKRELNYDGSFPLGQEDTKGNAADTESKTVETIGTAPAPLVQTYNISRLNKDEEAELQRLTRELQSEIPEKQPGKYQILELPVKQKIVRAAQLAKKKGHGNVGPLMTSLGLDYHKLNDYRISILGTSAEDDAPVSGGSQDAGAGNTSTEEIIHVEEAIEGSPVEFPSDGKSQISSLQETVSNHVTEDALQESSEDMPVSTDSQAAVVKDSPASVHSSNGYHPSPVSNNGVSSTDGHVAEPVTAARTPVRRNVMVPRAYVLPDTFKRPAWLHASSMTNGSLNEQRERADAMARGVLERVGIVISDDPVMQEIWHKIRIAAQGDAPVLLRGQPGVGKEPFARAIHELHKKNDAAICRSINSSGITETLAESELFGHDKGSFTGADRDKKGAFELVDGGGTIVLDEIGDMPMTQQAKLLRAIENREYIRVGSEKVRTLTNVKIIASTNRPLEKLMRMGLFRSDLYSRLTANEIQLPKLEERSTQHRIDLIDHFLKTLGKNQEKKIGMTEQALARLLADDMQYKDNVRGLRNHLERACNVACLYAGREVDIELEHITQTIQNMGADEEIQQSSGKKTETYFNKALTIGHSQDGMVLHAQISLPAIDQNSQDVIEAINVILCKGVVEQMGGNQSAAAEKLDITRGTLRNKLRIVFPKDADDQE